MDVNVGGWSLDQLMELAGLSVSQAGEHRQASNSQSGRSFILIIHVSLENAPAQPRKECPRRLRTRKQWYELIDTFHLATNLPYPTAN